MKTNHIKPLRLFLALFTLAALAAFTGHGPGDLVYENCSLQTTFTADCASFRADGAGRAKNVILLIGDGMGVNQTFAGRIFINGPHHPLSWEKLPHHGLVKTCSIGDITDSAASATALSSGYKTVNGGVGMRLMPRYVKEPNLVDQVHASRAAGVVSTVSIWDATPAGFAAHVPLRSMDRKIARQMIHDSRLEVILGGGARAFEPSPYDSEDLIAEARDEGYEVVRTAADLSVLQERPVRRVLGLFAEDDLAYEIERPAHTTEPHLTDLSRAALAVLERDPRGFFLMIEGGAIDHACHETDLDKMLGEMKEFEHTVELVLAWREHHPDTLVIITADHETGGIEIMPRHYRQGDRVEVTWTTQNFPNHANHSSQRVPVYAVGPNSSAIKKMMDNTEIFCVMRNAFDVPSGAASTSNVPSPSPAAGK